MLKGKFREFPIPDVCKNVSQERLLLLAKFEKTLGFTFKDKALLNLSLTHSSYASEVYGNKAFSYERLEFFGDSIISFLVKQELLFSNPSWSEGDLSKKYQEYSCGKYLTKVAKDLGVEEYLLLGGSVIHSSAGIDSILEDSIESLIAAVYLDGGIDKANLIIRKHIVGKVIPSRATTDPKTVLQEYIQKRWKLLPTYRDVSRTPHPDKKNVFIFVSEVSIPHRFTALGEGESKKMAQSAAAMNALCHFLEEGKK